MKQEFINFLNELMKAAPEVTEKLMTDNIKNYINALMEQKVDKPLLTDNGKLILSWLQKADNGIYTAKTIAEGLFVSSRNVSGSIRKLVTDGFVEKVGESPALYSITEKGKNFKIEE